jgi:hypothetical protein
MKGFLEKKRSIGWQTRYFVLTSTEARALSARPPAPFTPPLRSWPTTTGSTRRSRWASLRSRCAAPAVVRAALAPSR